MTSKEYIDSGILENYVMGMASHSEGEEVEMMAAANPDIRQEIEAISDALEEYALAHTIKPSPSIKPLLMATIDYSERIKNGEPISFPPVLNENSKVADYATWLNRPDLDFSGSDEDNLFAKIIGYSPEMTTAIVWIKQDAPREIHHHEHERFLIIEGSCDILVGDKSNPLVPGDYFDIPLHEYHTLKVTSSIACKAILQRVAA
jgi:mannose-6-phosphate isomerase-like protein (cupin superfamily)